MDGVLRLWRALDERFERVEAMPWGAIVTDGRFPRIWDVNYARVETDDPALRLGDVAAALDPALEGAGAAHRHIVLFHPESLPSLVVAASSRGARLSWDAVMVLEPRGVSADAGDVAVAEVTDPDERFLDAVRDSLVEFDVADRAAAEQLMRIEREVMLPAGKRWFRVIDTGREAALGSLLQVADVGMVDHVVTLPFARRRGYAEAIVRRIVAEARTSGIRTLALLAEPSGNAQRIYERIGFGTVATIASTLERR